MKTKVKIIFVSVVAVFMLIFGLVVAINKKNISAKQFSNNGYIIGNIYNKSDNEIEMVYFNRGSLYKNHSADELKLTDTDGKNIVVSKENFVHYSDDSLIALKDGVAIDLGKVDSDLLTYYNIFAGSVLQKGINGYEIQNINDTIIFDKLMFKISDNKYLVAADNILAYFSDNQTISFEQYVEIEYVDENVIRIYNDKSNYQTISSNLYLLIDNIKIDLGYKTIEKNNIEYLTMANLVINSNDNIEVLPEKITEEQKEGNSNTDNNNNNNSNSNNNNNNGQQNSQNTNDNSTQNNIDTSILEGLSPIDKNESIEEEENVQQPRFTVENLDVTRLGFENLKISMIDEDNIIYANNKVEIIENSTGKVIEELSEWNKGLSDYTINSYSNLKPDTEYTLTVSGQYMIDEVVYDRVFVSKIFRTLDIGLEIVVDCLTSNSLSFAIYKTEYSDIKTITYDIFDSNNKSVLNKEKTLEYGSDNQVMATTPANLNSNTKYKIVVKSIQYSEDVISTENSTKLQMTYEAKTLKQTPFSKSDSEGDTKGDIKLVSKVNSLKNQLVLGIENVNDINKGIKSYTYKVYRNDGIIDVENQEPKYVATKDDSSELLVNISELEQGDSYYFNVEIEFDDNEKTIIYSTHNSEPIYINDTKYPQVGQYTSSLDVECEQLSGILEIYDEDNFIKFNNIKNYKLVLKQKNNSYLESYYEDSIVIETDDLLSDIIQLPVKFENLKPNTEYVISVYLENNSSYIYIGYENVKTNPVAPLYLELSNIEVEKSSNLFEFSVELNEKYFSDKNEDSFIADSYMYIKNNLDYITLDLVGCNDESCKSYDDLEYNYGTNISNFNNGTDLNKLLNKEVINMNSEKNFGFKSEDYKVHYKTYGLILKAYSFSNYEIPINVNNEDVNHFVLQIIDNVPTISLKANYILNEEENKDDGRYIVGLNDDTVIGFKFDIKETNSTKGIGVNNFYYAIYEGKCEENHIKFSDKFQITEDQRIITNNENTKLIISKIINLDKTNLTDHFEKVYFEDSSMLRGKNYCMVYQIDYKTENGEIETIEDFENKNLIADRQKAKIIGYLSKYDGEENNQNANIMFRLKVNDVDSEIVNIEDPERIKFYLKNDSNFQYSSISDPKREDCQNEYCDYNFSIDNIENLTKFGLSVSTKKNESAQISTDVIYEFAVDTLKFISQTPELNVDDIAGKLIFTLPDPGFDVLGLKITNSAGKNSYLELEKRSVISENNEEFFEYVGTINNDSLENYGINKTDKIDLRDVDVEIIYANGSISNDSDKNQIVAIKQANLNSESEIYYYNYLDGYYQFNRLFSVNSIYERANGIIKNLKANEPINIIDETDIIGQSIDNTLIHLYNLLLKEVNLSDRLIYVDSQLLTNNQITYTSTGANLDFSIVDQDIFKDLDKIKFELICPSNGGNSTIVEYDYNQKKWTDKTDIITPIYDDSTKTISIELKNIDQYTSCSYSLKYTKLNNADIYSSIDSLTGANNEGTITSLKALNVSNKNAVYDKNYWNVIETENDDKDVVFEKLLRYSFEVTQNYKLTENERIDYNVKIKDNGSNVINLGTKRLEFEENSNKISSYIDLFKDGFISPGIYQVHIEPYIIFEDNSGRENISLQTISFTEKLEITNNEPIIQINSYQSKIEMTVNDSDGIFDIWSEEYVPGNSVNLSNVGQNRIENIYNNKKYYFEILKDKDSTESLAYKEIGFSAINRSIDVQYLFNSGKISNGNYYARVCYYSITNTGKTCSGNSVNLFDSSALHASIISFSDSYILEFKAPDEALKDKIVELVGIWTDIHGNNHTIMYAKDDIVYSRMIRKDGTSDYYISFPVNDVATNFEVAIYVEGYEPGTTYLLTTIK